jgi:hypothetical protein
MTAGLRMPLDPTTLEQVVAQGLTIEERVAPV